MKSSRRIIVFFLIVVVGMPSTYAAPQERSDAPKLKEVDWTKLLKREFYGISRSISKAVYLYAPGDAPVVTPGPSQAPGPGPGPGPVGPTSRKRKPLVLLIAIHGTFAKDSTEFQKESDPTFQSFKNFATQLAIDRKAPVLLVSFGWSGLNEEIRRKGAGSQLARMLNDKRFSAPERVREVFVIAHSHGGNVAHFASQTLRRPVDVLVDLGTPRRVQKHYAPDHIKTLYNLYSTSDPVQVAGSVVQEDFLRSLFTPSESRRQPYQANKHVVNVSIKLGGVAPGHIAIKDVIAGLYPLLHEIEAHYKFHDDLISDISFKKGKPDVTVVINKYLTTLDLVQREASIDLKQAGVALQLAKEVDYSLFQEGKYASKYQSGIRSKGNVLNRMARSFIDAYRVLKSYAQEKIFGGDEA